MSWKSCVDFQLLTKLCSLDGISPAETCIYHCHVSTATCISSIDSDFTPFVVILAYYQYTVYRRNEHCITHCFIVNMNYRCRNKMDQIGNVFSSNPCHEWLFGPVIQFSDVCGIVCISDMSTENHEVILIFSLDSCTGMVNSYIQKVWKTSEFPVV